MRAVVAHAPHDLRIDSTEVEAMQAGQVTVRIKAGGICGSDMHYFQHGGFGTVRLKEPMILGHEVAGEIAALGPGVSGLKVGDRVAVNPSRPCRQCSYCLDGLPNHCEDMRFYGSAMRTPHIQGAFREALVCEAIQCEPVAADISFEELALCEPFSVALHAIERVGSLLDKRVLITGTGPIGALVVAAARYFGAREIVATDVVPEPLVVAAKLGADRTIDVAAKPEDLAAYGAGKGSFDIMIECSGNGRALQAGLDVMRPRGTVLQLGVGGNADFALSSLVAKELSLVGSFRFHPEFALAAKLIGTRKLDLRPVLSGSYPIADALKAFEAAGDRRKAMKVQIAFN